MELTETMDRILCSSISVLHKWWWEDFMMKRSKTFKSSVTKNFVGISGGREKTIHLFYDIECTKEHTGVKISTSGKREGVRE